MLKPLSLALTLLGILVLLIISLTSKPILISSLEDIKNIQENTLVSLAGQVNYEKSFPEFKIIKINNITLICKKCPSYKSKKISIIGKISDYEKTREIIISKVNS